MSTSPVLSAGCCRRNGSAALGKVDGIDAPAATGAFRSPTLSVTFRKAGGAVPDVISTYPKYTPLGKLDPSTLTVRVVGVVPEAGVTESQPIAMLQ
jgi:hypothetical protein